MVLIGALGRMTKSDNGYPDIITITVMHACITVHEYYTASIKRDIVKLNWNIIEINDEMSKIMPECSYKLPAYYLIG